MKTPLPLGSPAPQKKKKIEVLSSSNLDQTYLDQMSLKIKQKITLALFFSFQFCDVNHLAKFPQKIIKFVEFTMEKKNSKFSQFLVQILTQKNKFTKIIGVKSLLHLWINVMFNHGILKISFVVFGENNN